MGYAQVYTLVLLVSLVWVTVVSAQITKPIKVDQFGYRPTDVKVALIADPQTGFNSADSYTIGASLAVKRFGDNATMFTGTPTAWNAGATHTQSGDKVWRFDFTSMQETGRFYIQDLTTLSQSDPFYIKPEVYLNLLKAAVKTFYYQRSGLAKAPPFTDSRWFDNTAFLGPQQDPGARNAEDQGNAATAKDLRGGWFDAGDYNKYTINAAIALQDLMLAYEEHPTIFGDDWNIPESGNGIPDILDEIKWELDWLLRMQQGDGSVLSKVSSLQPICASPPSTDTTPRYWGVPSTASTAMAAGTFAHGARLFITVGQTAYATTLQTAAQNAWTWAAANPSVNYANTGFGTVNPDTVLGAPSYRQPMSRVFAAAYLYALTGNATYKTFFENNYTASLAITSDFWTPFEAWLNAALLYYTKQPGITAGVATDINNSKIASIAGSEFYGAVTSDTDAYLTFLPDNNWVWGSNRDKAQLGNLFADMVRYNLDTPNQTNYRNASQRFIHYLHGVNAVATVFLSNVYAYDVSRAVNEIFHCWYRDGTNWDNALTSTFGPAPGYLAGGPNPQYTGNQTPPLGQPVQKAWRDFNSEFPANSWEITEPAIYYQAAYIRLLADMVTLPATRVIRKTATITP